MKSTCLLLLAGSFLLLEGMPLLNAPVQAAPQTDLIAAASPAQACNLRRSAVVTVYAGSEIGSGSIVSSEGVVITNNHVIKQIVRSGGSQPIYIKLSDGNRYAGKLIKTDVANDLALIKMQAATQFPTVPLADPSQIEAGQSVCAIGSPYGRPGVITAGSVNLVRRNGDVQSQVVLKPGNSGGPLLNARGEMVGVNRAILESAEGVNTGISIASNIQAAKNLIEQSGFRATTLASDRLAMVRTLPPAVPSQNPAVISAMPGANAPSLTLPLTQAEQRVVPTVPLTPSGGHLGVRIDMRNLVVRQVESGSPAALSGLQPGDRLLAVNGAQLIAFSQLQSFLNRRPSAATFIVSRNQQLATIRVMF